MSSFRSNSKPTISLPEYIKGKHGIIAMPVHSIEIDDYYKETVLNIKALLKPHVDFYTK